MGSSNTQEIWSNQVFGDLARCYSQSRWCADMSELPPPWVCVCVCVCVSVCVCVCVCVVAGLSCVPQLPNAPQVCSLTQPQSLISLTHPQRTLAQVRLLTQATNHTHTTRLLKVYLQYKLWLSSELRVLSLMNLINTILSASINQSFSTEISLQSIVMDCITMVNCVG